jgi:hypothetical protein
MTEDFENIREREALEWGTIDSENIEAERDQSQEVHGIKDLRKVTFSDETKACRLWEGSMEQTEEKYMGGPTIIMLEERQAERWQCNDATASEKIYWACLELDLENARGYY